MPDDAVLEAGRPIPWPADTIPIRHPPYPQVWIVHTFGSIVTFLVLTNLQSNVDTISRQPVDEVLKVGNLYLAIDK